MYKQWFSAELTFVISFFRVVISPPPPDDFTFIYTITTDVLMVATPTVDKDIISFNVRVVQENWRYRRWLIGTEIRTKKQDIVKHEIDGSFLKNLRI